MRCIYSILFVFDPTMSVIYNFAKIKKKSDLNFYILLSVGSFACPVFADRREIYTFVNINFVFYIKDVGLSCKYKGCIVIILKIKKNLLYFK